MSIPHKQSLSQRQVEMKQRYWREDPPLVSKEEKRRLYQKRYQKRYRRKIREERERKMKQRAWRRVGIRNKWGLKRRLGILLIFLFLVEQHKREDKRLRSWNNKARQRRNVEAAPLQRSTLGGWVRHNKLG